MKKTMKKALIVMAVVITAMLMMTFMASAATDCGDGMHLTNTRVIVPTCTTDGYTETYCTVCEKVFGTSDHKVALGHDYDNADWNYHNDGDHFLYVANCARDCGTVTNDGKVYHSVTFVNPWVAETFCDDVTYAKLAETWTDEQVALSYVVKGETVSAEGITASRQKDKDFGEYVLSGWTLAKMDSGEFTDATLFNFAETAINGNTVLYAAFTGNDEVYYQIQFYNSNNAPLTKGIPVRHGHKADDDIFQPQGVDADGDVIYANAPTRAETNAYYYIFDKWNIDIEHIYGNTGITALYTENAKLYEYVYCDYEGNELGEDYRENLGYGQASKFYNDVAFEALMARPKDRTYIYAWMNSFVERDGRHETAISSMIAPVGALDTRYKDQDDYSPIYLVPQHVTRLVSYEFDLTAVIPSTESDIEYYLDKISVQIRNDQGQLVAAGTTKAVNGKAVFTHALNDSKYYEITAVTADGKYTGSQTLERNFIYDTTYTKISTTIYLEISQDYIDGNKCSCIHHISLIRPLWVRILNLLYRIFNVKYVCCDDMYATIGELLAYTR